MSEDILPFSDTDYRKLDRAVFPTIRRRDKYGAVGEVKTITHGPQGSRETIGSAEIIAKETITWESLPWQLQCYDTESGNGIEAYDAINKFYRNDIAPDEELTLYWLKWVDQ